MVGDGIVGDYLCYCEVEWDCLVVVVVSGDVLFGYVFGLVVV